MTLPRHAYGDPLQILLDAEARTCKGCIHLVTLWGTDVCAKDPSKSANKLKRCKRYDDGTTNEPGTTARKA